MAELADVLLFVVDARAGITPDDRHYARWVHALKRPVLLLANKSEGLRELDADCWQLGFGAALPVSAEHGEGLGELYTALQVCLAAVGSIARAFPCGLVILSFCSALSSD
jgi:GTP-binding protein